MENLNFETGIKHYAVNGVEDVLAFNPTDGAFVSRLYDTFMALSEKQDSFEEEMANTTDNLSVFELAKKIDAEMRKMIDGIFGKPVCNEIFGNTNVYALASGLPLWVNFFMALLDEVDGSFSAENAKTDARIAKYTAKYAKK